LRPTLFLGKKPPLVPDPGQRVRLHTGRGRWRGRFRTVSYPYTNASGVVVVRVAEEWEYRDAVREGRRAVGVAWPAEQMEVLSDGGSGVGTVARETLARSFLVPSSLRGAEPERTTGEDRQRAEASTPGGPL
jgi:hypothetical protein